MELKDFKKRKGGYKFAYKRQTLNITLVIPQMAVTFSSSIRLGRYGGKDGLRFCKSEFQMSELIENIKKYFINEVDKVEITG